MPWFMEARPAAVMRTAADSASRFGAFMTDLL
jgi:hypothetical protein